MLMRLAFMLAWLAFVAACSEQIGEDRLPVDTTAAETAEQTPAPPVAEPEPAPPPRPERPTVEAASATIDWAAARADLASASAGEEASGFQIQSGDQAPPVPVLIVPSSARPASATGETPRFRELPDGYFAHYPGDAYDVTVSGTNEVFATGSGAGARDPDTIRYQATASGAIVSLTRYGADYMVEFECNGLEGTAGEACIDEDEALDVARQLIIAGSR